MFQSLSDPVALLQIHATHQPVVLRCNTAFEILFGLHHPHDPDLFSLLPADFTCLLQQLAQQSAAPVWCLLAEDGSCRHFKLQSAVKDSEPHLCLLLMQDISEQENALMLLKKQNEELQQRLQPLLAQRPGRPDPVTWQTDEHHLQQVGADEAHRVVQVEAGFAETVKVMGHVDNCVANSGVSGRGKGAILEMTTEEWRRVLRVNLDGVFFTFRAAARHMAARGKGGSLVAMASTAAIEGAARSSHYGASKGGVTAMVRALAVELARYKIAVNSILPGWIETEMTANAFGNEKFAANVMPRIPERRWGVGADFGPIAVYLASDASAYTTGRDFVIDGGYTLF